MPVLYPKHTNYKEIIIGPLDQGLDLSQDETVIGEQNLAKCNNFEYDYQSGRLIVSPGVTELFDADVDVESLYFFDDEGVFVFTSGLDIYKTDLVTKTKIGTLNGLTYPMFTQFNNSLLIVSGKKLQQYKRFIRQIAWSNGVIYPLLDTEDRPIVRRPLIDNGYYYQVKTAGTSGSTEPTWNTTIGGETADGSVVWTTIEKVIEIGGTNCPDSDIVFIRSSRVILAKTGSDYLTYSAVGDETDFSINGSVESDAQQFGVSLQDSMDISCIVPLSSDLVIYKRNQWMNMAGRILGEPLDFEFKEVSRNAFCNNKFSALQASNDVYFLGPEGFKNMSNVVDYGDIKQNDVGIKINKWLIGRVDFDSSRLFHLPSKRQIYIKSQSDPYVTIYHYFNNAYTIRRFNGVLTGLVDNKGIIYISKGQKISKLDKNTALDDGIQIPSELITKTYKMQREILIQRVILKNEDLIAGNGIVTVGNISLPFSINRGISPVIYDNDDLIYDNDDLIFTSVKYLPKEKRQIDRGKLFNVKIVITSGSITFNSLLIGASEVSY